MLSLYANLHSIKKTFFKECVGHFLLELKLSGLKTNDELWTSEPVIQNQNETESSDFSEKIWLKKNKI